MTYSCCPTCGELIGRIKEAYDADLKELCEKEGIDHETFSRKAIYDEALNEKKKAIMDKYTDPNRTCCRMRIGNGTDPFDIVR